MPFMPCFRCCPSCFPVGKCRERKESGGILPDVDIPVCRLYGADGFPGKGTVFEAGQAVAGRWRQSGADAALFPACVKRAHCVSGVFPGLPVDGGFSVVALPAWRPSPELLEWTCSIAVLSMKRPPRAWENGAERQEYSPGRGNLLKLKILK